MSKSNCMICSLFDRKAEAEYIAIIPDPCIEWPEHIDGTCEVYLCDTCLHFYRDINPYRLFMLLEAARDDCESHRLKPDSSEIALGTLT